MPQMSFMGLAKQGWKQSGRDRSLVIGNRQTLSASINIKISAHQFFDNTDRKHCNEEISYLLKMKVFCQLIQFLKLPLPTFLITVSMSKIYCFTSVTSAAICIDLPTGHNLRFGAWWGHRWSAKICKETKKNHKECVSQIFFRVIFNFQR